jgi:hypothetical protein
MAALDVEIPKGGLTVAKDDTHRAEILTIAWPLSVPIPDAAALRRAIAWLQHPIGLQVSRGELLAGQSPGLIEIAAPGTRPAAHHGRVAAVRIGRGLGPLHVL